MTAMSAPHPRLVRLSRTVVLAASFGWAAYVLASWVLLWNPADGGAYYDAALRVINGEPLYLSIHPEAHEVYRYAPWFAYAWIPLTVLPRDVALHVWSLAMLGCSVVAVWPLLRRGTPAAIALAALLGSFLAETAMFGNVHPAVVALLVVAARSRWMPVAVGIATSIKLVPILFILPWARVGGWGKTVVAVWWPGCSGRPHSCSTCLVTRPTRARACSRSTRYRRCYGGSWPPERQWSPRGP